MDWLELKRICRVYGFVAHARTIKQPRTHIGFIEYSQKESVENAIAALEGKMLLGCWHTLRVRRGAASEALLPKGQEGLRKAKHWS